MNFAERYIYDHLNIRQAGVLEFAGPCTGKECKTCMHFNEKISELTQSSDTKKPTPSNLSKAKQLRSLKKKHRSARTASNAIECPWCGDFHPKTAEKINEENKDKTGLPRPTENIEGLHGGREFSTLKKFKQIPIPWSINGFSSELEGGESAQEKTDRIIPEHLCLWCGEGFKDSNEQVSRLKSVNGAEEERAFPMHNNCMRQLATFCPHINGVSKYSPESIETGPYSELRENAEKETGDLNGNGR